MSGKQLDPVQPDGIVRTALELLPIPPHDDDFWTRLEATLDADAPHVAPEGPVPQLVVAASPAPTAEPIAPVVELEQRLPSL